MPPIYFRTKNVTVPPLVVLVLLDDRPGLDKALVVDHPREATVSLVNLEQSIGIKGPIF